AKLAQLLQEAALVAVRRGHGSILQSDVDDVVDRLTVGPKRVGIELGHQGQCRRATTEVLLGGRAAEEVIYGRDTSRASVSYLADRPGLLNKILTIWNMEKSMTIHGKPPPWRKGVSFVEPRLDFEGSLYDDYDLMEPPINFNLDDDHAQRTEELIRDMYKRTISLQWRHHAALLKTIKVCTRDLFMFILNEGTLGLRMIKHLKYV
ncbi:hypothetical protein IFM89_039885, partial [Coptis chinensis]